MSLYCLASNNKRGGDGSVIKYFGHNSEIKERDIGKMFAKWVDLCKFANEI